MAESQSGFDLEQYKADLDGIMASVMPDTWRGHGRLKILERDFSEKQETFAAKLFERLADKYPNQPSERLAEKAADKAEEKF
jgi:hypothetical protein